jgi:hypothetical protein
VFNLTFLFLYPQFCFLVLRDGAQHLVTELHPTLLCSLLLPLLLFFFFSSPPHPFRPPPLFLTPSLAHSQVSLFSSPFSTFSPRLLSPCLPFSFSSQKSYHWPCQADLAPLEENVSELLLSATIFSPLPRLAGVEVGVGVSFQSHSSPALASVTSSAPHREA